MWGHRQGSGIILYLYTWVTRVTRVQFALHSVVCMPDERGYLHKTSMLFLCLILWPSRTPDKDIRSRNMTSAIELAVHNKTVRYNDRLIYLTRLAAGVHNLSECEEPFLASTKIFVNQYMLIHVLHYTERLFLYQSWVLWLTRDMSRQMRASYATKLPCSRRRTPPPHDGTSAQRQGWTRLSQHAFTIMRRSVITWNPLNLHS